MTETETEAETLERLETALRRIGDLARHARPASGHAPEIDREALLHSLDLLIGRLRNGLELTNPAGAQPGAARPLDDGVIE